MASDGRAASARRARVRRAGESYRSVSEAIGVLEPGIAVFCMTLGQWGMVDAIRAVLDQVGTASISCWTWCVADYEVEVLDGLRQDARVEAATLIVDRSMEQRKVSVVDSWRAAFGPSSVRVALNHSKCCRVWNDRWRVLMRGSMNLNYSARFESFDLTEGGEDFAVVERLEAQLPALRRLASYDEAADTTGLSRAHDLGQLSMFKGDGLKVWTP